MLVAVAAMTFTACSEKENDNTNNTEQKAYAEFVGVFDETRSAFGDKVGNSYPSYWEGNESAIFHNAKEVTGTNDVIVENSAAANENAIFLAELKNTNVNDKLIVVTPADTWESDWNYGLATKLGILNSQTPKANSVDPKVHALKAEVTYKGDGQMHQLNFKHEFAYGKMTLINYEGAAFDNVKVTLSSMYGPITMTVNTSTTENIWFACYPVEKPSAMTIEITDSNGTTHSRDLSNAEIIFVQGKVTNFKVDMKKVAEEENESVIFTSAIAQIGSDYGENDHFVTFTSDDDIVLLLNGWGIFQNGTWPIGTYLVDPDATDSDTGYLGSGWGNWNGTTIYGGSVEVSVVNGEYHIEFINLDGNYGSFTGLIEGLDVP